MRIFLCLFGVHRPNRERIWDDGLNMRARCKGCKRPMVRMPEGWRLFRALDYDERRAAHPRAEKS